VIGRRRIEVDVGVEFLFALHVLFDSPLDLPKFSDILRRCVARGSSVW
jgi:hypothetical protein